MSRPSNRQSDPASSGKPASSNSKDADSGSTAATRSLGIWKPIGLAVFVLAATWYVALISLAVMTGNPVTLNRVQMRESSLIVAGSVDENGTVSHILVFKGIAPEGEIVVSPFPWPPGEYILPLRETNGRLEVTPTKLPGDPPLVYPANDESIELLQQTLK